MDQLFSQMSQMGGGGGAGGFGGAPRSETLLEFKAGRLNSIPIINSDNNFNDNKQRLKVSADARRGKIVIEKSDDHAIHFKWIDRYTSNVEQDLLLFPNDQSFIKVNTGNDKDRVYLLQFKTNNSERFFYWMQEPDESKDEDNVKKLTNYMTNNPTLSSNTNNVVPPEQQDFMQLLQNLDANNTASSNGVNMNDLSNAFSSINTSNTTTNATNINSSGGGLTQDSLQNALQGVASAMQNSAANNKLTPNLEEIVKSEDVSPLLDDEKVVEALLPLLPDNMKTKTELRHTLTSPQLRQALVALSSALQSNNFNTIMASFQLNPSVGANEMARGDGIGAFLAAIQKQQDDLKKEDDDDVKKEDLKQQDDLDDDENMYD